MWPHRFWSGKGHADLVGQEAVSLTVLVQYLSCRLRSTCPVTSGLMCRIRTSVIHDMASQQIPAEAKAPGVTNHSSVSQVMIFIFISSSGSCAAHFKKNNST